MERASEFVWNSGFTSRMTGYGIGRRVDVGDEPRTVGAGQRVLDLVGRQAEGRRLVPVEVDIEPSASSAAGRCSRPAGLGSAGEFLLELLRGLHTTPRVLGPCSVYWYSVLVIMPPMRMGGGFCMKTRTPGTTASLRPQLRHELVRAELALLARLQPQREPAGVGLPPPIPPALELQPQHVRVARAMSDNRRT